MQSMSKAAACPLENIQSHARLMEEKAPARALRLYALVDAAQDQTVCQQLKRYGQHASALLSPPGGPAERFSPHLIELDSPLLPSREVERALRAPRPSSGLTLLLSPCTAAELHEHLTRFTQVRLQGGVDMVLACWDPAILATLVGQADDDTLHVPGPVLDPSQLAEMLQPIVAWWYCDRASHWHRIDPFVGSANARPVSELILTQDQEDMLVEAGVPDQVLYHLELNQPLLFEDDKTHAMRYAFVKSVLGPARQLGLESMRDLGNFTVLCLIYGRRLQTDPRIVNLLEQVQRKVMTLDEAMRLMPT